MKTQATESTFTASHEEIANRARQLWESYGHPSDRDQEIWLEAERQLLGENPVVAVTAQTPVRAEKAPAAKAAAKKSAVAKR